MTNFSNKICLRKIQVINFNSFKSKYQKLSSKFMQKLTKTKPENLKVIKVLIKNSFLRHKCF